MKSIVGLGLSAALLASPVAARPGPPEVPETEPRERRHAPANLSDPAAVEATGSAGRGGRVVVGDRLRVTAPGVARELFEGKERRFTGELLSFDEETLTVAVKGLSDPAVVPRAAVDRLEVSRAPGRKGRGFLIGLAAGTAVGVALVAANGGTYACDTTSVSGCDLALSALLFGLPGAIVGALVAPGERWEEAEAGPSRLSVGIGPAAGGGVGASLRWRSAPPPPRELRAHVRAAADDEYGPPPPAPLVPRTR